MEIENKSVKNILMILSYFVYQIIPILIISLMGIKLNTDKDKIIFTLIVNIIYLIFVLFMYRKELKIDIKNIRLKTILKYIPIYLIGVLLMIITNMIAYKITGNQMSANESSVRTYIKLFPVYMCFSAIIYAPLIEEIIFRKSIRNIVKDNILYIIASGLVFGLIHMNLSGNMLNNFIMAIPYIIMGIDFAYIYHKSNNIFTTIIIHSMHNMILVMIQIFGGN